jgi:APA family basic amino acid/polyamine antiporter
VAVAAGANGAAGWLDLPVVRVLLPLAVLWCFVAVNVRGLETYQRVLLPLLGLTFLLGAVVIVAGFFLGPQSAPEPSQALTGSAGFRTIATAAALLFSSFIGFDAIAQVGGEARDPSRTLPLAIGLAISIVAVFYALFAGAVYHAVPWTVVRDEALRHDTSAAALLGARLPGPLRVAVVAGAAVALVKDLPAMLLGVSRLMFAWAEDGIVPRVVASVHPRFHTPRVAIVASAVVASLGILGCQLAGDFFLGVDILVTSMLVNFLLMCGSVLALPGRNPALAQQIRVLRSPSARRVVGIAGIVLLGALLVVHTGRDLGPSALPWYLRSTVVWLGVMALGSAVYWHEVRGLRRRGVNVQALFAALPPE